MRLAVCFLALLATRALANPPPGIDIGGAEHKWWECHIQPGTAVSCCRASDGHVLEDSEWRAVDKPDGSRSYQIHIGSRWYDVPSKAVVNDVSNCGPEPEPTKRTMAKVWYAPTWDGDGIVNVRIYCFMVGTMY
jgi:hypothetical protein